MAQLEIDFPKVLSSKRPKVGDTVFIAIDGQGGSGKSTLAALLSRKLNAQVVRTDDFASWDNPLDWWPLVVERIFMPIKSGAKTLSYPRSEWWDKHNPGPMMDQPVTNPMILEGVSASRKEFRDYLSLIFFVDTPKELCLQRGLERDAETGHTREALISMWEGWFEAEDRYMERDKPKMYADFVLDGTKPFDQQI